MPHLGFDEAHLKYYAAMKTIISDENDKSIVLRVNFGSFSCLLSGDATFETMNAISDVEETTIFLAAHHGSAKKQTNPSTFIDRIRPKIVVFSSTLSGFLKHPAQKVVERIFPHVKSLPENRTLKLTYYREKDDSEEVITDEMSPTRYITNQSTGSELYIEATTSLHIYGTSNNGSILVTNIKGQTCTISTNNGSGINNFDLQ